GEALHERAITDRCGRDDPRQEDDGITHRPDAIPQRHTLGTRCNRRDTCCPTRRPVWRRSPRPALAAGLASTEFAGAERTVGYPRIAGSESIDLCADLCNSVETPERGTAAAMARSRQADRVRLAEVLQGGCGASGLDGDWRHGLRRTARRACPRTSA